MSVLEISKETATYLSAFFMCDAGCSPVDIIKTGIGYERTDWFVQKEIMIFEFEGKTYRFNFESTGMDEVDVLSVNGKVSCEEVQKRTAVTVENEYVPVKEPYTRDDAYEALSACCREINKIMDCLNPPNAMIWHEVEKGLMNWDVIVRRVDSEVNFLHKEYK